VVVSTRLYGGSVTQFTHTIKRFGWSATFVDFDDLEAVRAAIDDDTRAVFCESIANPGGYDACVKLVSAMDIFSHVANLGDTRSLIIHSASTTQRQLTTEQLDAVGATPDTVRLSIGIEDVKDLIADLDQALSKVTA